MRNYGRFGDGSVIQNDLGIISNILSGSRTVKNGLNYLF